MKPLQINLPDKEGVPQDPLLIPMEPPHVVALTDIGAYLRSHPDKAISATLTLLGMCAKSHLPARSDTDLEPYAQLVYDRLVQLGMDPVDIMDAGGSYLVECMERLPKRVSPEILKTAGE